MNDTSGQSSPNPEDQIYKAFADAAKKLEAWAIANPAAAALLGGAIGLATAIAFNKVFAIKGAMAFADSLYGAAKGAAVGYAYPSVRDGARDEFSRMADEATQAAKTASRVCEETATFMDGVFRRVEGAINQTAEAARAAFG